VCVIIFLKKALFQSLEEQLVGRYQKWNRMSKDKKTFFSSAESYPQNLGITLCITMWLKLKEPTILDN
jgi:hypothetical protein